MPSDVSEEETDLSMPGRPRSGTMDELTVEIKSEGSARKYRCAGHTKRCIKLTTQQRQFVSKCSADTSPGARAEELSKGLSTTALEDPAHDAVGFFGTAGTKQVRERNFALLDLAIVKLFAAAGLPPRLADYPEYKDVLRLAAIAGPHYIPAGRTILMDNHIMSEQERVRCLQIDFLQTQTRLTVSFDGGDVRSGEYFYTVHANTAEGRSFILEGHECTTVSHTAQWMAGMVFGVGPGRSHRALFIIDIHPHKVMETVGIERFVGVSSDSTSNTLGCRRILTKKIPTMLDLPDPNHHLGNTVKDVLILPYFKLTIKITRGGIKKFGQSKQAKEFLKQLRKRASAEQDISIRGIERIGKTRFANVTWSSISVKRNLDLIRTLCTDGRVEIKKYNAYFIEDSAKTLDYQLKLNQLIAVTEGAARAIQCLEGATCNPADVFLLWLAVTAHVRAALKDSAIPEDVCNDIRGIYNARWQEFFVTNPGHDAYLAAFYLNPKYVNSSIFKRPNAVAPPTIKIPGTTPDVPVGIRNPKTFIAVGKYLFDQGVVEIEHGVDPVLIAFKKKKTSFVKNFKSQFTAYGQGVFPFNTPLGTMHPRMWWRTLEASEHGGIIALYSAVPHSMADERTVSVITWINPALRNLAKVNTLFGFAQIRGWYKDVRKQKELLDGTAKTRASARPSPEVKFYNIQRDIETVDDDDKDIESEDSEDESEAIAGVPDTALSARRVRQPDWLDLPQEIFTSSGALDLEMVESEVDLDSTLLLDVLADMPIARGPVSGPSGEAALEDDEDDDMDFDLGTWAVT
ncbi:ribonuclease H-like domain-containing protein [Mycena alexandri]|uniref:Ribonuclease H-like domain-containing protein n=1 Tax=Mycena alexandri TaxID=1745969 RepID=A0AAD6X9M2_9AGAR|nr:ribonuclease H-like domain-containing protein [Mycena alexandri]